MEEHGATVLLAVAEEDEAEALARLREARLHVLSADTADAVAAVGRSSVDVLVVASPICAAPNEVVREAFRLDPGVEIVMATVRADFENALACLRAGASDIIAMPIEGAALLSAVHRALERRRARGLAQELLGVARSTGLGELAGSIAHEIANPIAILAPGLDAAAQSLATLAELGSLGAEGSAVQAWWERSGRGALEQASEVVSEAQEAARRLKIIARDLRALATCDPSALADCDVAETVEAALRVARAELTLRVKVAVDVPRGLVVHASRCALMQALVHVLVRGAHVVHDAGLRRGNILVRARDRGATVSIEVEDDVSPPRTPGAARFLEPYLPAGAPVGSGALGLAVARDLVERQGGSVSARPTPGGGTLFDLQLPSAARARVATG